VREGLNEMFERKEGQNIAWRQYSKQLFKDIQTYLPIKVKKDAPSYFKRYGNDLFYSSFSKNKNTTWYVFYSIHEENGKTIFLVRYLGNNHIIAHHLLDDSEV
jgi:hypothetical protein